MKKNRYSEKGVGGAEAAAGGGMNASLLEGAMDEALEMEREATVEAVDRGARRVRTIESSGVRKSSTTSKRKVWRLRE